MSKNSIVVSGTRSGIYLEEQSLQQLLRVELSEHVFNLWIGEGGITPNVQAVPWEHTIYELENLACALRLAAQGGNEKPILVETKVARFGAQANLTPAIIVELGHPGIGKEG